MSSETPPLPHEVNSIISSGQYRFTADKTERNKGILAIKIGETWKEYDVVVLHAKPDSNTEAIAKIAGNILLQHGVLTPRSPAKLRSASVSATQISAKYEMEGKRQEEQTWTQGHKFKHSFADVDTTNLAQWINKLALKKFESTATQEKETEQRPDEKPASQASRSRGGTEQTEPNKQQTKAPEKQRETNTEQRETDTEKDARTPLATSGNGQERETTPETATPTTPMPAVAAASDSAPQAPPANFKVTLTKKARQVPTPDFSDLDKVPTGGTFKLPQPPASTAQQGSPGTGPRSRWVLDPSIERAEPEPAPLQKLILPPPEPASPTVPEKPQNTSWKVWDYATGLFQMARTGLGIKSAEERRKQEIEEKLRLAKAALANANDLKELAGPKAFKTSLENAKAQFEGVLALDKENQEAIDAMQIISQELHEEEPPV